MSKRIDNISFVSDTKLIIGEGDGDRHFVSEFCAKHGILGFQYASTGMNPEGHGGFDNFGRYLSGLPRLTGAEKLTDIVLMFDATDDPARRFSDLCKQVQGAVGKGPEGDVRFAIPEGPNQISDKAPIRMHALMVPHDGPGGLETVCLAAARDADENRDEIMEWVDTFANSACKNRGPQNKDWSTEKTDKLRLQAFISAGWDRKPDMHFYQLFDITKDKMVPLGSDAFSSIKVFLTEVEAL